MRLRGKALRQLVIGCALGVFFLAGFGGCMAANSPPPPAVQAPAVMVNPAPTDQTA